MNNLSFPDFLECLEADGLPRTWCHGDRLCDIRFFNNHYTVKMSNQICGHLFRNEVHSYWMAASPTFGRCLYADSPEKALAIIVERSPFASCDWKFP